MNLQLQLPRDAEAHLREIAVAAGQDVETFVLEAVRARIAATEAQLALPPAQSRDEWLAKLQAFINSHPVVNHFVDDSRESIYEGRGE